MIVDVKAEVKNALLQAMHDAVWSVACDNCAIMGEDMAPHLEKAAMEISQKPFLEALQLILDQM